MPRSYKLPKISRFFDWFIPLLFFLPTSIGGWLVHFGLLSPAGMLITCFIISIIAALYLAAKEENEEGG
jgi:hypothetical protein